MSDIKIAAVTSQSPLKPQGPGGKDRTGGFDAVMKEALGKVNEIHNQAEQAIEELAKGGDITRAVIAMEKADMSFQVMVEVRNKLLAAYEEIMRMQV
jgi:flagellar hook-basal body complex protein FliE